MEHHTCPYCGKINHEHSSTLRTAVDAYLPPLVTAGAVTAISAWNKGVGLATGGLIIAYRIVHYVNGKKVTCGNCNNDYSV